MWKCDSTFSPRYCIKHVRRAGQYISHIVGNLKKQKGCPVFLRRSVQIKQWHFVAFATIIQLLGLIVVPPILTVQWFSSFNFRTL